MIARVGCGQLSPAFHKHVIAPAGFKMPDRTRNILVSVGSVGKAALLEPLVRLQELGYHLYATEGTKAFLDSSGKLVAPVHCLHKPSSGKTPAAVDWLQQHRIDLVINDPEGSDKATVTDGYLIRRSAVDFGVSLITNIKCAALLCMALDRVKTWHIRSMEEYYAATASAHAHATTVAAGGSTTAHGGAGGAGVGTSGAATVAGGRGGIVAVG